MKKISVMTSKLIKSTLIIIAYHHQKWKILDKSYYGIQSYLMKRTFIICINWNS